MLRIALIALLMQGAVPQQPPPAAVQGVVVRLGTGEPVSGATVQLLHVGQGSFQDYTASTAQDGKFLVENVAPGDYRLVATRGGFVAAEYGQRAMGGRGINLGLVAGQKKTDIQLAMAPAGSISGRVYDDRDGEPIGKAQVQALRPVYRDGRRVLTIAQSVETNDRGEYRLFGLAPGQYYVSAKADNPETGIAGPPNIGAFRVPGPSLFGTYEVATGPVVRSRTLTSGEIVEEAYVPVYYPGTMETQRATPVVLGAAANLGGVDVPIGAGLVRTRRIRGIVMYGDTGQPAAGASIVAVPRTFDPSLLIPNARSDPNGSFDVPGVVPGSYAVFATSGGLTGGVFVDVGDDDVQLAIIVTSGFKVSGRFVIEGRSRVGTDLNVADLRVTLRRDPDMLGMPSGGPSFSPPPSADGSFILEGVGVGDFRVTIRALPQDAYVKSMHMGNLDVLDGGLRIYGPPGNPLEIVIGADAGTIGGTVVNARQEPLANRTVALVPDPPLPHRSDLYKSVSTDAAGRFRLQGVTPGTYHVFAWETVDRGAWQDPEFIRMYENRGKMIRISERTDENVQLTVIP